MAFSTIEVIFTLVVAQPIFKDLNLTGWKLKIKYR